MKNSTLTNEEQAIFELLKKAMKIAITLGFIAGVFTHFFEHVYNMPDRPTSHECSVFYHDDMIAK